MGIQEKIAEIKAEMARTQKNKATNYHIGTLKAKLAKLRTQLIEGNKSNSKPGEGFDVLKSGAARCAMVGYPSVGKSSFLSRVTKTESRAAAFTFTTLTCIPGVLEMNEAKIQLLDLPGIIEGAAKGKGRGRQVIAVARTADLICMVLEADKALLQKRLLTAELESAGIRLNQRPADVVIRRKKGGGITFNSTLALTHCDEKLVRSILQIHKIHNVDVLFREDATVDQFIDLIEGNRVYLRCLYIVNKIDTVTLDEVDRLAHIPHFAVMSIKNNFNIDAVLDAIWDHLDFIRVYTKPKGDKPSFTEPLIMRNKTTVEHVCHGVHRDLARSFRYALVWGTSVKHEGGQRVGLQHRVQDGDVVQIVAS